MRGWGGGGEGGNSHSSPPVDETLVNVHVQCTLKIALCGVLIDTTCTHNTQFKGMYTVHKHTGTQRSKVEGQSAHVLTS